VRVSVSLLVLAFVAAVIAAIAFACDEDFKDCYGTDYQGCRCEDGGFGYQKCSPLGDYQGVSCVCDGTTPGVDAGHDAATGTACVSDSGVKDTVTPASRRYLQPCLDNPDCDSCMCVKFNDAGRCTKACKTIADCPPPSDACTPEGLCHPGG
jgi:hypothetical protein